MAYGTKYEIQFQSRKGENFSVKLLLKDYEDETTQLIGASDPFLLNHESGDENIINPIRASECTINFYNTGLIPLTEFYSEDDEAWKIEFYHLTGPTLLWVGFIIQDSCQEQFTDAAYPVQLKGTDNLALLKNIPFDTAFEDAGYKEIYASATNTITVFPPLSSDHVVFITPPIIMVSPDVTKMDFIDIDGTLYTIDAVTWTGTVLVIHVVEHISPTGTYSATWTLYTALKVLDKLSLFKYLETALRKTGLEIPFVIYNNLYENSEDDRGDDATADMFLQTHLFSGMFQSEDGTWTNLYEIIEKILFPLNATLFQAGGKWIVIRWPELSLFTDNAVPGNEYDETFAVPGAAVTLDPNKTVAVAGNILFLNADATRSILRPFKYSKFTFNYQQPTNLIRNINLDELGTLISETVDGDGNNVRDYALKYWYTLFDGDPDQPTDFFIRVITTPIPDSTDETEKERYLVISGGVYGGPWLESSSFFIDEFDRVNVSFSFKTTGSNTGPANLTFLFETDDTIDEYRINFQNGTTLDGSWSTTGGAVFTWTAAQNINEWTTFSVESLGVPVDGTFSIKLNQADNGGGDTYYKDFSIEHIPYINKTASIIGHYHRQQQEANPKNVFDQEIFIDDTPKHSLAGALFTSAVTGEEFFTLTAAWHRSAIDEEKRLGEITTLERELMQWTPRTIIEGSLNYDDPLTSILNVLQIDMLPGLNFIFGVTEFNFMEHSFKATLWEIFTDDETAAELTYKFDYIFEKT
jgi:hypothetical protein